MATVGSKLTIPFTVGTSQIVGQGEDPHFWILYSTSDADSGPTWADATADVLSVSTSRGRDSELSDVDAGTATLVLDNRDRTYDPVFNSGIRPLNRWWIRSQFSGVTEDIFKGYAESYDQTWEGGGGDARAVVQCADEFKVLALDALPATDPPRDNYQDVVLADGPSGYWPLDDGLNLEGHLTDQKSALVGEPLKAYNGAGALFQGAIVGQNVFVQRGAGAPVNPTYKAGGTFGTVHYRTDALEVGQSGDVGGVVEFAVEAWVRLENSLPASTEVLIYGPQSNSTHTYQLAVNTAGNLVLAAKNSGGTDHSITSTTAMSVGNVWYHVVGTITGGNLRLYVNGNQEASTAWTGTFGAIDANVHLYVGNTGTDIGSAARYFDEFAIYRFGLSAARVTAHYNAGRNRGFAAQDPGARILAVLDRVTTRAPQAIRAGSREITPVYMTGQSPLDEMRRAENGEAVDAVLFIAKDGTITFLDDGHRSVSPWNTVQATFDDDGTDLPYLDADVDYSEAFLFNEWNVTREGGTTTTSSDATSISRYFKRSQSLTGLSITTASDQTAIASAMLAKYKDPFTRVTSLKLDTSVADVAEAALGLEIGDRIRVFRTPPGGGSRIDQTLFVQKIQVEAQNDWVPWRISLAVSPL